ncbi:MAG: hypothetical protein ACK559_05450, partial [bacterium]
MVLEAAEGAAGAHGERVELALGEVGADVEHLRREGVEGDRDGEDDEDEGARLESGLTTAFHGSAPPPAAEGAGGREEAHGDDGHEVEEVAE